MGHSAMNTLFKHVAFSVVLLVSCAAGVALAQEQAVEERVPSERDLLDTIRGDLVELRFESALAAIEALLGKPGMAPEDVFEAWVLRVQAHVAFGDFDAAEEDYRRLLGMRPGYVPESSLTPRKAMDLFTKVRNTMVGRLVIELDPPDAVLMVGGERLIPDPEGLVALLAGDHLIRAEHSGHDPFEYRVVIEAGVEESVVIRLTPNARTVIISSDQADVAVWLDGQPVGVTAIPLDGPLGGDAQLVLEDLPLGEHHFELSKACFRTERFDELLAVDLLDKTALVLGPFQMVVSKSTLMIGGSPSGIEISLDGQLIGTLPLDPYQTCPGSHHISAHFSGRTLWSTTTTIEAGSEVPIEVSARPNIVLIGVTDWPSGLISFGEMFNRLEWPQAPVDGELSTLAGWRQLKLPGDADLALAVVPASRQGARARWYLYSPILRVVHQLDRAPGTSGRPVWETPLRGLHSVDDLAGEVVLVAGTAAGSPAAALGLTPGDRIVSLNDAPVTSSAQLAALVIDAGAEDAKFIWTGRDGTLMEAQLPSVSSPLLQASVDSLEQAILRAAWALVDAISSVDNAPAALSNLALLLSTAGQHDLAVDTWRRVQWAGRPGIGDGTTWYFMGRELESIGDEAAAIAAYRKAAASDATAGHDFGPTVRLAATDRLADLGVKLKP